MATIRFFLAILALTTTAHATNSSDTTETSPQAQSDSSLCNELTRANRRSEALTACHTVVIRNPSIGNLRALLRAALLGAEPLTAGELAFAYATATRVEAADPQGIWGPFAYADIAARIGDQAMLKTNLERVLKRAPNDVDAQRALAAQSSRSSWIAILSLLGIFLVGFTTLFHKLRVKQIRTLGRGNVRVVALASLLPLALFSHSAFAEAPAPPDTAPSATSAHSAAPPIQVNQDDPESSVPSMDERSKAPLQFAYLLMQLSDVADHSFADHDYAKAAKFYRALIKAVPERSVSYARLCDSQEAMGQLDAAIESCKNALGKDGVTVHDGLHFSELLLQKETLAPSDIEDINAVLTHLESEKADPAALQQTRCELALKLDQRSDLESCTAALQKSAPNDPKTITFEWALAMAKHDYAEAEHLVARAKESSMKTEGISEMERRTRFIVAQNQRKYWLIAAVVLALGAALLLFFASRQRLAIRSR